MILEYWTAERAMIWNAEVLTNYGDRVYGLILSRQQQQQQQKICGDIRRASTVLMAGCFSWIEEQLRGVCGDDGD